MANRMSGDAAKSAAASKQKTQRPKAEKVEYDPTRPASLDLEAFIVGAQEWIPTKVVHISARPSLVADVEDIDRALESLDAQEATQREANAENGTDDSGRRQRMAGLGSERLKRITAERERLTAQREDAMQQLEGTWRAIKLRALDPTEGDEIRIAARELQSTGVPLTALIMSKAALVGAADAEKDNPDDWHALDVETWETLINAMGQPQYLMLDNTYAVLDQRKVSPDFFERHSASRATTASS